MTFDRAVRRLALVAAVVACGSVLVPTTSGAQVPEDTPIAAGRETDPVVLTGASLPTWSVPADVALEAPHVDGKQCIGEQEFGENPLSGENPCSHNEYEDPDVSTGETLGETMAGTPIDGLLGYRWTGTEWAEIPFQVDEMTQRYLSNNYSGFSFYSETDPHHTYIFDREGFRWTGEDPNNPCLARPESPVAADPVTGLDTDDELVFMARDTGPAAPLDTPLPEGIEDSYQIAVTDPVNGDVSYAYVMKASPDGPRPFFNGSNGYVEYERDANADLFRFSESSYENYGAAEQGPWMDEDGNCHSEQSEWRQHRPGDQATVTTPRYRFRYEGRWLMTELQVSEKADGNYGPDLIDQWKARAFQQRPSGETPCCGFEEEVNNWGGSSILMGERWGPVRVIRETWGADSGTNVVRREIFYREEIRFLAFLRVHVIPPLDGIYAQWDYNAGMVETYYNPHKPNGVRIDGNNDEQFGNSRVHVSRNGASYCGEDKLSEAAGAGCESPTTVGEPVEPCPSPDNPVEDWWDQFIVENDPTNQIPKDPTGLCIHNDIDSPDPTFSGVNAGLNWEQVTGDNGTIVWRTGLKHYTPGGTGQALFAAPYYRDDSCFDDGTGSNPGPHLRGRGTDDAEFAKYDSNENGVIDADDASRTCWKPPMPPPPPVGDRKYWQGSIGTHGLHILLIADSDNAGTTLPVTEIDTEQRAVILPGEQPNVGERYGRHTEKPLVAVATPESRNEPGAEPTATATPTATTGATPTPTTTAAASPSISVSPSATASADETASPSPTQSQGTGGNPGGGGPGSGSTPSGQPTSPGRPNEPSSTNTSEPPEPGPGRSATSIATDASTVAFRQPFRLSGQITADAGCTPDSVNIWKRPFGVTTARHLDRVHVDSSGGWTTTIRAKRGASYHAIPAASPSCITSASDPVDVQVRVDITVRRTTCAGIRGAVRPGQGGTHVGLEERRGRRWNLVDADTLDKRSRFVLEPLNCDRRMRIRWPSHQDVRNSGTRTTVRL